MSDEKREVAVRIRDNKGLPDAISRYRAQVSSGSSSFVRHFDTLFFAKRWAKRAARKMMSPPDQRVLSYTLKAEDL